MTCSHPVTFTWRCSKHPNNQLIDSTYWPIPLCTLRPLYISIQVPTLPSSPSSTSIFTHAQFTNNLGIYILSWHASTRCCWQEKQRRWAWAEWCQVVCETWEQALLWWYGWSYQIAETFEEHLCKFLSIFATSTPCLVDDWWVPLLSYKQGNCLWFIVYKSTVFMIGNHSCYHVLSLS